MKTADFLGWKSLLALASLPFLAMALARPVSSAAAADASSAPAMTAQASEAADVPEAATNVVSGTNNLTGANSDVVAVQAPVAPANVPLQGGTAEIVRLAQAGVGTNVMLSYISNTTSIFSLSPDQIIYLNDLGVTGDVLTAMIQHDAALGAGSPATANPADTAVTGAPGSVPGPAVVDSGTPVAPVDYSVPTAPAVEMNPYTPATYPPTGDAGYFYDSLAPYGTWVNVANYGLCWQPTVNIVDRGWRPYGDRGRWLYSDNGWYWQSDYSWGWAAFHYGRWFRHDRLGWVWTPDRVWGPAWVSWRATGDYAGWAPLPPAAQFEPGFGFRFHGRGVTAGFDFGLGASAYTFVPTARLSDYYPVTYGVTRVQRTSVFNQSVVVNNAADVNHQVILNGVEPWRVVAAGGTPVRHAILRESQADPNDRRVRSDRVDVRGNSLVIFRPALSAPAGQAGANSDHSSRVHVNNFHRDDAAVPVPSELSRVRAATGSYASASVAYTAHSGGAGTGYSRPANSGATTILVPRQTMMVQEPVNSVATTGETRALPTAPFLTPDRNGNFSRMQGRAADAAQGNTIYGVTRTTSSGQPSVTVLPSFGARYGVQSATPSVSRSQSYGSQFSSPEPSSVLLPSRASSYSAPASAPVSAPGSRSYQAGSGSSGGGGGGGGASHGNSSGSQGQGGGSSGRGR